MTEAAADSSHGEFIRYALETVIRVGVVILLAAWCFDIVKPFVGVLAWGIIIAIALDPLYERLQGLLGGRRVLASVVFTVLMLILLITPTAALVETLFAGSQKLAGQLGQGESPDPDATRAGCRMAADR